MAKKPAVNETADTTGNLRYEDPIENDVDFEEAFSVDEPQFSGESSDAYDVEATERANAVVADDNTEANDEADEEKKEEVVIDNTGGPQELASRALDLEEEPDTGGIALTPAKAELAPGETLLGKQIAAGESTIWADSMTLAEQGKGPWKESPPHVVSFTR